MPYTGGYVMRNASLKVASTEYGAQVTKARIVPDTPVVTTKTIDGGVIQDVEATVWTIELTGVQSSGPVTGTGLDTYLLTNQGTQITLILKPVATGRTYTVTCVAMPVAFGDEAGKQASFDITLPVVGTPTIT